MGLSNDNRNGTIVIKPYFDVAEEDRLKGTDDTTNSSSGMKPKTRTKATKIIKWVLSR